MKQKEVLLWAIAIFALVMSSFAVLGPKLNLNPLSSDASIVGISGSQVATGIIGGIKKACKNKGKQAGDIIECTDSKGQKKCYRYDGAGAFPPVNCETGEFIPVEPAK